MLLRRFLWVVLIDLVLFVAYCQGVINERKRWQYCDWNIIKVQVPDAAEGKP